MARAWTKIVPGGKVGQHVLKPAGEAVHPGPGGGHGTRDAGDKGEGRERTLGPRQSMGSINGCLFQCLGLSENHGPCSEWVHFLST